MTDKQPDALRMADELDCHNARLDRQAAKVIRTQHADLLRKDALLRQALDITHEAQTYTESESWSPSMTKDLQMLHLAITKELQ